MLEKKRKLKGLDEEFPRKEKAVEEECVAAIREAMKFRLKGNLIQMMEIGRKGNL